MSDIIIRKRNSPSRDFRLSEGADAANKAAFPRHFRYRTMKIGINTINK
jgi:hypothetical protein